MIVKLVKSCLEEAPFWIEKDGEVSEIFMTYEGALDAYLEYSDVGAVVLAEMEVHA